MARANAVTIGQPVTWLETPFGSLSEAQVLAELGEEQYTRLMPQASYCRA